MAHDDNTINSLVDDLDDEPTLELAGLSEAVDEDTCAHGARALDSGVGPFDSDESPILAGADPVVSRLSPLASRAGPLVSGTGPVVPPNQDLKEQIDAAGSTIEELRSQLDAQNKLIEMYKHEIQELRKAAQRARSQRVSVSTIATPSKPPAEERVLIAIDDRASTQYTINSGQISVGSSPDNDIHLQSDFISGHHAQIISNATECILRDLNSTNGTFVNSSRIKRRALRQGDSVMIGRLHFKFITRQPAMPENQSDSSEVHP